MAKRIKKQIMAYKETSPLNDLTPEERAKRNRQKLTSIAVRLLGGNSVAEQNAAKREQSKNKTSTSKGSGIIPNISIGTNNKRPDYVIPGTGATKVKPNAKPVVKTQPVSGSTQVNSNAKPVVKPAPVVSKITPIKPTKSVTTSNNAANPPATSSASKSNMTYTVSERPNKMQATVTAARSTDDNMFKPMSKRDRIRRRQGIRTEEKSKRVGQQIERIRGRQARKGVTIAKRDIKRDDSVRDKSYDATIRKAMPSTTANANKNYIDPSQQSPASDQFKVSKSPQPTTQQTTQKKTKQPGTVGSTLGVSTLNSKTQVKKPQKLRTNAATPVSANSKMPGLRGLEQKNQKSVNKSSKNATNNSKKPFVSSISIEDRQKKLMNIINNPLGKRMPRSSTSITKPASGPRAKL